MSLKNKIANDTVIGIFSKTTDSSLIEIVGISGLDFVILDMEHGISNIETVYQHIRAAKLASLNSIVRVTGVDHHCISMALDSGASGIQVPNINTANQVKEVIKAARFYPYGNRGVCRFVRAAQYGEKDRKKYFDEANQAIIILQVEGLEGVKNLDEILNIGGFDVLFVGPYDLSQSVGKPGEIDSFEVKELIQNIADKAKSKGIALGAFCDTYNGMKFLIQEGFSYIAYSVDMNIFLNACKGIKELLNNE